MILTEILIHVYLYEFNKHKSIPQNSQRNYFNLWNFDGCVKRFGTASYMRDHRNFKAGHHGHSQAVLETQ